MQAATFKVLLVTAHPDDAEIYVWASLCAWQAMGAALGLVLATSGEAGVRPGKDAHQLGQRREQEALASAATLGLQPRFLRQPDGALAHCTKLDAQLAQAIADFAPTLVVTHHPQDYHPDHRAVSAAVGRVASFRAPVLWMDTLAGTGCTPNVYVDTTAFISAKVAAIRCHQSQDPERFVRNATKQSVWRAYQCNAPDGHHAEAFCFEPAYPFSDVRALLPAAPDVRAAGGFERPRDQA